ncbi:trans-aconitate 2-methyltransferase [Streptomyces sp. Amel2xC10]|uniref:class I SAM-dependent methyltransferase n=1 Tax=Streptomyces sp. Amel2xC10 TaxID=1305826 RepID=UPI000A08556F|nr:class I SAM-dependent methyltransferase [Streptomyces sp. Amel2xC10]SMF06148.1 Methyltransferase domain-containing protein [Streptomyces sp. Amel2xC10]
MTSPDTEAEHVEATNLLYRDPALYDLVQADSTSAATCLSLIERYRPEARTLVDFGCGTGRDLEVLAERFECVGVDLQPGMVGHARRVRPELDIRVGDMRTARLGRRADVVTCVGNSLAYVHDDEEISQVFATFAAHARPGALLVLCSPVAPVSRTGPTTAAVDTPEGPATVTVRYVWDPRTRIDTMYRHWALPSGAEAEDVILRRVLFPHELERHAEGAGFEVLEVLAGPTAYTVARSTRP